MKYPRQCHECHTTYQHSSGFASHITNGVGARKCAKNLVQQRSQNITSQNTNNALAIPNNSIFSKQDMANCMSTSLFQGCPMKEKRQIHEVFEILHNNGYRTPQAVQDFIMKEVKTIQHFEQEIKTYSISAMRAIASSTKPKKHDPKDENSYKDEHINNFIEALFNILICNDDAVITPQACNPLFKSSGSLKVWFKRLRSMKSDADKGHGNMT